MSETLIKLVSHYSPSGQERVAAEWLVTRMKALGYEEAFIDDAGNTVGVMGHGPHQVVLLGHIDTVPGEIPLRVENNILYGRGAVDAKGPLACFVDAVAKIGRIDGWQFIVIGAVEEERDSCGARFVVDQYKPNFAIIGEPNRWDRVALGYKGSVWAEVTLHREQAHSASGGQTACEAAVKIWLAIQVFAASINTEKQRAFDKVLPTLRAMESGQDGFEQWARLEVGARLPLDLSPEQWYARLDTIAANAEVTQAGYAVPAWTCEKNSRLVRAFLSGIRNQSGSPSFVYKTGTSDLNIVAPVWKCPTLVYGPGDSALDHTPAEQLSLQEYQKAVNVLTVSLQQLTQQPGISFKNSL